TRFITTFCIVGTISISTFNCFWSRFEKLRINFTICYRVFCENLKNNFVGIRTNCNVELSPSAPFTISMLPNLPFTFPIYFQTS
ncbi:MAG: hypothetical protein ACI9YB_002059, partial [Halioglobus sp.]